MTKVNYLAEYDRKDPTSIERYSQRMIGKSFRDIWEEDARRPMLIRESGVGYSLTDESKLKRNKGNLGQIIEEKFFHYACNNDSRADFYEAGVELKVTPYRINQNGKMSAKERLILTMIDYYQVVDETFEESHFWNKSKLILLVYYLYTKEVKCNLDYKIGYSRLFTPPEQDVKIIRHDYYIIVSKIKAGKAHELSEGDTLYLGAAPKASTSKARRGQPFSEEPAKPRAFAFKSSYMTYVLNNYIVSGKATYEQIVQNESVDSFEDYVVGKIDRYRGFSVNDLCKEFEIEITKRPKNLEAMLAYRILGIKGNHAEEFEKANIAVKTIRIGKNDRIKENMSFPTFRFKKLIQEDWEHSTFGNYLRETRFLFVVYKFDKNDILRLRGCQFWNIPYEDLETEVRSVWERTKQIIENGLQITMVNGRRRNNLPKASENPICHVRPHAQNAMDTYELPDGRLYPKQCFWLNNTYIYQQIDDYIKFD
ncbi:MAG: restriction endonuclease [Ruminococcus sp.]|jgi:DNA mismatch repair protein MutH|nr:Sau3AI family type II restriction endonuclease [uncultured Schaedlerella sp.]MCI9152613.1 restriction endonuclease [Ruminococcus sp.]